MLARHPRDRYQTASELIIDLERSALAAPLPSFADPDLARTTPGSRPATVPANRPASIPTPAAPKTAASSQRMWSGSSATATALAGRSRLALPASTSSNACTRAHCPLPPRRVCPPTRRFSRSRLMPSSAITSPPKKKNHLAGPPPFARKRDTLLAVLGASFAFTGVLGALVRLVWHR